MSGGVSDSARDGCSLIPSCVYTLLVWYWAGGDEDSGGRFKEEDRSLFVAEVQG